MIISPSLKPESFSRTGQAAPVQGQEACTRQPRPLKKPMEIITKGSDDPGFELRLDSELGNILLRTRQPYSYVPVFVSRIMPSTSLSPN